MRSQPDLSGRRVLVVDDDAADRQAVGRLAEAHGCLVREAGCHTEMTAVMRAWDPEMLVLDVVMPEVDGIGILRRLAEQHCRIPVLLVSAYKDMLKPVHNLASVYGLRVVGEISKPVAARRFEAALRHVFAAPGHGRGGMCGEPSGGSEPC
jgi:two-component system OmpR family response regulator